MTVVLMPLFVLALVGLAMSLIAHIAALFGLAWPLGDTGSLLYNGVMVVWAPAILVSCRLTKGFKRKDFWRKALRGCPPWMRWLPFGFFGYAFITGVLHMLVAPAGTITRRWAPGADAPPVVILEFSGILMACYAIAAAVLYSAMVVTKADRARRCPNGHPVSPSTSFCEVCGSRVAGDKTGKEPA